MSDTFLGKVVIVTGASNGIGAQIAMQLATQGAILVLAARRVPELEEVALRCRVMGRGAIVVAKDVANPEDCAALVDIAMKCFGHIDMLVNNAGIGMWARADEVNDLSIFERIIRVNYLGAVYCTLAALPHLKASRGRIVCVSSLAGRTGVPLRSGYAASKHAMHGFFDSLRIELGGTGVSVTMVCPGFVGTGIQARNLGADGVPLGVSPVNAADVMTPDECARIAIRAAAARKREEIMTARGKIGMFLKVFFPALMDRITAKAIARGK